jgi:hypothetical protein
VYELNPSNQDIYLVEFERHPGDLGVSVIVRANCDVVAKHEAWRLWPEYKRLLFCAVSPLAALFLASCLSRPPIDAALVPQGAPALLRGAQLRIRHRWNPHVSADITHGHFLHSPAHGRNYT